MRRILLIGRHGQVGWELQRTLAPLGEVISVDHPMLDLADPDSIMKVTRAIKPHLIVNAAAYTAVDKAESEPDMAMAVNGVAPGILAEEAKLLNAAIVHYSTDYVFDGFKDSPYVEDDEPNPLNVYGSSKLAGERAIQAVGVPHLILRTSWVYGLRGKNFLLTVHELAKKKDELRIVEDQKGAPTWSRMLAEVTSQMLSQLNPPFPRSTVSIAEVAGLYHVVSSGSTSWYGFAKKILEHLSPHVSYPLPEITPIPASEYPLPARRPQNSSMSCEKLNRTHGLVLPSWEESLMLCMDEIVKMKSGHFRL